MSSKIYYYVFENSMGEFELHSIVNCTFGEAHNYIRSADNKQDLHSFAKGMGWKEKDNNELGE